MVGIGVVEDRLLESLHLVVHFVCLNMGLEHGEVVNGALSVGGGDNIFGVLPDVFGDFSPGGLDGGNGVG